MSTESARLAAGGAARRLAAVGFGAVIVLSPLRAGILLAARPRPPLYAGFTDLFSSVGDLAAVATLALWLASLALSPRPVRLGPGFLRWPVAGLLALAVVGAAWSLDPVLTLWSAAGLAVAVGIGVYALNEVEALGRLVLPVATMVGLEAVVGIGQVLGQGSVGLAGLGELSLDPRVNGVSVVAATATDRLLRAYGLTDHPNILGGLLAIGLVLLAVGLVGIDGAGARGMTRRLGRTAGVLAISTGTAALVLTFSRAAGLALVVGLLVVLVLHGLRRDGRTARRLATVAAGVAAIALVVGLPLGRYVAARLDVVAPQSDTELMSVGERAILADAAGAVFAAHPLGGTGLATLPLAMTRTRPALTFDYQPASVVVLDVLAETGVLGAACYGLVLVVPLVAVARRRGAWTRDLVAATGALAAVTVIGFFDYYTWSYPAGRIWAWLVLGLWTGAYVRATQAAGASHGRRAMPALLPTEIPAGA